MKLITYAEEPICNNFSMKKKWGSSKLLTEFSSPPPPQYFLLPLICPNVEVNDDFYFHNSYDFKFTAPELLGKKFIVVAKYIFF